MIMDPIKHITAAPSLSEIKTTGRSPSIAQRTGAGILDFPILNDVVSEKKEKRHRPRQLYKLLPWVIPAHKTAPHLRSTPPTLGAPASLPAEKTALPRELYTKNNDTPISLAIDAGQSPGLNCWQRSMLA
jgi:hypothetical protein